VLQEEDEQLKLESTSLHLVTEMISTGVRASKPNYCDMSLAWWKVVNMQNVERRQDLDHSSRCLASTSTRFSGSCRPARKMISHGTSFGQATDRLTHSFLCGPS
jgi:hypothetical protein